MEKRWIKKKLPDNDCIEKFRTRLLEAQLPLEEPLVALLMSRGITTVGEALHFFNPDINLLHDPFLMKDMDKAISRISHAIIHNEKIMIYGDYDVDGTSAVALVYSFLSEIIGEASRQYLEYYIPHRYTEGYGISERSIEYCHEKGVNLFISLDCGIKAYTQIELANRHGIDVIVCDHHLEGEKLPDAVAILNPKREGCPYPYKELSGCGVGLKLIQAYCMRFDLPDELWLSRFDLVAISIASDIVPITGENRIIAYYGLEIINKFPRPGIKTIIEQAGFKVQFPLQPETIFNREITVSDLVFYVGPRINAAGRMETGRESVRLFICEDEDKSSEIGKNINAHNDDRKEEDRKATEEAILMIKGSDSLQQKKSIVLYNPNWFQGIIGIVASRLVEEFYKPAIVLTKSSDGLITGSARSVKEFNLYDAIDACADLLEHFGGHKFAAGLSMKEENLEAFMQRLEQYVAECMDHDSDTPEIEIDMALDLKEITSSFITNLKRFAPFGPGNMSPIFLSSNVVDEGGVRILKNEHLKLRVLYRDRAAFPKDAIAFGLKQHYYDIRSKKDFHIVYHLEENSWNNITIIQLNIKDIKIANN
ncbi:MAG: single-stranded-DNA-specific exonuclease RecJ [Bacteroidales bacterium]|jgi:single-stranded-DNA-specific exonuclease|nr:single-stranded-DNA-specific exonuclease RecJ [Bacteroidales bacterium]